MEHIVLRGLKYIFDILKNIFLKFSHCNKILGLTSHNHLFLRLAQQGSMQMRNFTALVPSNSSTKGKRLRARTKKN